MYKMVYEIDQNGYIIAHKVGKVINGIVIEVDGINDISGRTFISVDLPNPSSIIKHKWNGSGWEEGESEEERKIREDEESIKLLVPTPEELFKADLEIKMITLLMEMGAI